MIPFAAVDRVHQMCGETRIAYHRVAHPLFGRLSARIGQLARDLGEDARDEEWVDFLHLLRRYRFELAAAPLPFSDPVVAPRWRAERLRRFGALIVLTFPRFGDEARDVIESLLELTERAENPLLDTIASGVQPQGGATRGLLLAATRLIEPTRLVLATRAETRGVSVVTTNDLRGTERWDELIVVGAARWFPDYVFSAPRSPRIDVVSYGWLRGDWEPAPAFLAPVVGRTTRLRGLATGDDGIVLDDVGPDLDWTTLERQWTVPIERFPESDGPDLLEARLYLLEGGYAVFLDASGRKTTMVIDLEADERARVRQVADGDIEPGIFVVIRTDNSGDYIVPVANRILGEDAAAYRAALALWKDRLRERVRQRDALEICVALLDLGSTRADEGNLRNWMSERSIAPQDRDDFAAIMRLVGLDENTDRLWTIARRIRNAHLRAGVTIRRRLVERVKSADIADLERRGRLDFELPEMEGGRLTAFRVEARSNATVLLPGSRIERAFALDELED